MKQHWEKVYERNEPHELGWYEKFPEPSLHLIENCNLNADSVILIAGAGTSTLIDRLLEQGYSNLIASDISSPALNKLKQRLNDESRSKVQWIVDDLTNPEHLSSMGQVDLWHDRAVLHFFCDQKDQDTYFTLLRNMVRPGGFVILAQFSLDGADRCSGLPVNRYNKEMLSERLGSDFLLLDSFDVVHPMPNGEERPYIYTLFQMRKG